MNLRDKKPYEFKSPGSCCITNIFAKKIIATNTATWNNWSKPKEPRFPTDIAAEIQYITCLIVEGIGINSENVFRTEMFKWDKILTDIIDISKDQKRPINAVRRKIINYKIPKSVTYEIELGIQTLIAYRLSKLIIDSTTYIEVNKFNF